MPTTSITMRKLKEILRLKYGCKLSHRQCCGQVFTYIMTGAFMLLQPQRDLNIDCNYVLYDNCNVEYIS